MTDQDDGHEAGKIQERLYGAYPPVGTSDQSDEDEDESDDKDSGGHTLYDKLNECQENDDQPEESSATYTCQVCEYVTKIDTPQIRVPHWCQGCSSFAKFVRSDKLK